MNNDNIKTFSCMVVSARRMAADMVCHNNDNNGTNFAQRWIRLTGINGVTWDVAWVYDTFDDGIIVCYWSRCGSAISKLNALDSAN